MGGVDSVPELVLVLPFNIVLLKPVIVLLNPPPIKAHSAEFISLLWPFTILDRLEPIISLLCPFTTTLWQ